MQTFCVVAIMNSVRPRDGITNFVPTLCLVKGVTTVLSPNGLCVKGGSVVSTNLSRT